MGRTSAAKANLQYAKGLARAFGGALLFSLPLLMTMEMWWLGGFSMDRSRLLIFLLVSLPMLLGLSYFSGFEPTFRFLDEVLDALAALAVGFILAAAFLGLFGVLNAKHGLAELVGKVALAAVPAAIGALVAGKQFAGAPDGDQPHEKPVRYPGELFLMAVGAVFLAFNVAPTEEMLVIGYMMGPWHGVLLILASIVLLHGFVYSLGFPGQDTRRASGGFRRTFMTFTLPGYAIALLVSLYTLWTFGRLDGVALHEQATMTVVLGFPAALGAATARLVI